MESFEVKNNLEDITLETFKEAIYIVMTGKIKIIAPLGIASEDLYIYGKELTKDEKIKLGTSRTSQITIRNYSNSPELLITDKKGRFLFYGKYGVNDYDFIANEFYNIFLKLKDKINYSEKHLEFDNIDFSNVEYSVGFDMLKSYCKDKEVLDKEKENERN